MQFAFIQLALKSYILDSQEMESVDLGEQVVVDGPALDEQSTGIRVCFGAYIAQHGIDAAQAEKDLLGSVGHWLGYLDGPTCHLIALQDVIVCGPVEGEFAHRIAFAAAVQAPADVLELIDLRKRPVTAFVRSKTCSPIDNLLNRSGVFALSAQATDLGEVRLAQWRALVDPQRARYAASKVD